MLGSSWVTVFEALTPMIFRYPARWLNQRKILVGLIIKSQGNPKKLPGATFHQLSCPLSPWGDKVRMRGKSHLIDRIF